MYTKWSILFRNHVLTDGALEIAETHGAYWLMDAIASYHSQAMKDSKLREIQFWTLTVKGGYGTLVCRRDSGQKAVITQQMMTDFPDGETSLWVAPQDNFWVIFTPSEY